MRLALCAVAIGALLATLPPSVRAYEIEGRPWPGGGIRYFVEDGELRKPVKRAAKAWNARKLGVRFVNTPADDAKVFFRLGQENCGGAARVGYPGRRGYSLVEINTGCGTGIAMLTSVHELGHVLGLGHEGSNCARMNSTFGHGGTPGRCERRSLAHWLEHPLTKDDVRGARALY